MSVACLMMQKNEAALIEPWVRYHGELFGYENLFIFDNGSNDADTIQRLEALAAAYPIKVDATYRVKADFQRKGQLFVEKILSMESEGSWEFFIPLDCDEFLSLRAGSDALVFDRNAILAEIDTHRARPEALVIPGCFYNIPDRPDYYYYLAVTKTFFARGTAGSLDVGFHDGRSRLTNARAETQFALLHFHNKPFEAVKQHAKEKLEGRVVDFSPEVLRSYNDLGAHLVRYFFMSEEEYLASFPKNSARHIPGFRKRLAEIGASISF